MRVLRIALVAILVLPASGDGRPLRVPVFSNGVCLVPGPVLPEGLRAAALFWFRTTGDARMSLSVAPDQRVSLAYGRIVDKAHREGLRFKPPVVRVTKPELALVLGPGIRYVFAMHYPGPRIILLNGWWLERLDSTDLDYLLAHELGHAIDVQNERRGHRYLDMFSDLDDADMVADVLSMLLVSPDAVFRFEERHQHNPTAHERH